MIAMLKGTIIEKNAPKLIIDVHGVGYEVFVPLTIYETLPEIDEIYSLKICYIKKETSTRLYGFNTEQEKDLFEMLITVNGIGDKSVFKFLNKESATTIRDMISNNDIKGVSSLPGIGVKKARKLLLDLSEKIMPTTDVIDFGSKDAINTLVALGYKESVAKSRIKKVIKDGMSTSDIIKNVMQWS